jgi:hypothetical protein
MVGSSWLQRRCPFRTGDFGGNVHRVFASVLGVEITNEQKADRLEEMAFDAGYRDQESDAALLRECAAMMRARSTVEWHAEGGATKNGLYLWAGPVLNGFVCLVLKEEKRLHLDWHPTLEAARSAAVAWVDQQEGRDV